MTLATIAAAGILLLSPSASGATPRSGQSAEAQQASQTGASGENMPGQKPASPPCSEAQGKSKANCKPATSKPRPKKETTRKEAKSHDGALNKKVIRNGGTGEPTVAISSDEGQRQARIREMNRLLAAADLNLKDVAVRGATASQETTIKQIRSYMDEAKAAANNGDVERAYNLANKANMLAADLNGP